VTSPSVRTVCVDHADVVFLIPIYNSSCTFICLCIYALDWYGMYERFNHVHKHSLGNKFALRLSMYHCITTRSHADPFYSNAYPLFNDFDIGSTPDRKVLVFAHCRDPGVPSRNRNIFNLHFG
jgi:hypothetical protein